MSSDISPKRVWQPPTAEQLQTLLPQYEVASLLGRGGMGAVYKGRQLSLDRPVAIKILSADLDESDMGFAERFKNEARAMAKLGHPGIVAVYDFGQTESGLLYIVMEFIEGTDVSRMISKKGRLPADHAMAVTAHVCDALAYAHERGIIHRDIKPANIMVGYDGVVKVADFGLAKMAAGSEAAGLTQSGMAMGTLHYMAPEALMLGTAVDHRADVYAVGVMLYQMLTGKLPQGLFEMPSLQVPGLDPRYDRIISKALREDRDIRYQSVTEMRHDLDRILTQPVVKVEASAEKAPPALPTHARPHRTREQPERQPQHQPQPIAVPTKRGDSLLWVAVPLIICIAVWLFFNGRNSNREPAGVIPEDVTTKHQPSAELSSPKEGTRIASPQEQLITNSLGMKFVPVPGIDVLFCIHETRYKDYAKYAFEVTGVDDKWKNQNFSNITIEVNSEDCPVLNVNWEDCQKFCDWLSRKEGKPYRLPTDKEWSYAVGIGTLEQWTKTAAPGLLSQKVSTEWPWGNIWPPPNQIGNYSDDSRKAKASGSGQKYLEGYNDDFPTIAPVMSFDPNKFGLYDMGGNVWEWCDGWYDAAKIDRVVRGAGWTDAVREALLSSRRNKFKPETRRSDTGFRCVMVVGGR
jgi:serine/threonine protein kinase